MIAIVDYGAGNLRSVELALRHLGVPSRRACGPEALEGSSGLLLPGVGAAASAMASLEEAGLADPLRRLGAAGGGPPLLGICLGAQLLTEASDEGGGRVPCLGLLPGETRRFPAGVRLPQVGWNRVRLQADPLFEGLAAAEHFYFNHAHRVVCEARWVVAEAEYGEPFPAAVRKGRVAGVQFHPEKSGHAGLRLLRNFWCACEGAAC